MKDDNKPANPAELLPITWNEETIAGLRAYAQTLREAYHALTSEEQEEIKVLIAVTLR